MTTRAARRFVRRASRVVVVAWALGGSVREAAADAPTNAQCIAANENAQTLRRGGKLQAARAELLACVVPGCPSVVRDDCAERLDEIEKAIPTIVFSATGSAHEDLSAVTVTMDGEPLTEHLGGSPVRVDPGDHTFAFVAEGYTAVVRKLVVREGVKGRQEVVAFASSAPGLAVPVDPNVAASTTERPTIDPRPRRQRTIGYVIAGAGVLGIGLGTYFGLHAKATYDDASAHCPAGPASCDGAGVNGGHDAHAHATVSTVAFVAGGALIAGGVFLVLTAPKVGSVTLRPTAGARSAGFGVGGVW